MIKAKLFVLGTIRELLWTDLEYHRYVNPKTGRCGEIPQGGLVTLSFISDYDDDRLLRWMTHSEEDKFCTLTECKIVFYEGDFDGPTLFEYKYNDTALVYWKETFNSVGEEPMTVTMTISAAIQEVKGITLVKPWQESWIPPSERMPYQSAEIEDNEPRIVKQYITDLEDIQLNQYERSHEIYCVLETKNMHNETVDIDLSTFKVSLLYRGERVQDNIIKGYTISADEEKIPLQVIPEDHEDEQ